MACMFGKVIIINKNNGRSVALVNLVGVYGRHGHLSVGAIDLFLCAQTQRRCFVQSSHDK